MINPWSYEKEYKFLSKKILKSLDRVFKSNQLFFGKELGKFEKNFIKTNKSKYGAGVKSGTEALIIALKALNIKNNDEVITVSNTAIPTIAAIKNIGAKVKFVDVNEYYLMDIDDLKKKITKKTKAIIAVHLYGQSCDMSKICLLAKKNKIKVIEDCAQAHGAKHKGIFVGNFGDIGCFSFYPTKNLGAYGDGGFLTTKNLLLYQKIRRIRFYGIEQLKPKNKFNKKYYSFEDGINSRLDEIQSSILNLKMIYFQRNLIKKDKLAKIYNNNLDIKELILPKINMQNNHTYHQYVVRHKKRDKILKLLKKKNINLNIIYPYPTHFMPPFKQKIVLKKTEKFSKEIFSLPIYPELKKSDQF
ncbi:DegT/DnrJ/EryC1/StrS family aminotransferase, partial [Pelagibacteraceae bacterium]|nr:DegT/DnrJ/EryC1/StrS family aminotransferase [Pelagibacteraceae bacterium]